MNTTAPTTGPWLAFRGVGFPRPAARAAGFAALGLVAFAGEFAAGYLLILTAPLLYVFGAIAVIGIVLWRVTR